MTTERKSGNGGKGGNDGIIGIQAARYVAAVAVLIDHYVIHMCEQGMLSRDWLPFAYRMGALGVCMFFAISGFVMVVSNRDKFQLPWGSADFLARRVIRIWPMYFLATMIVFALRAGADPLYTVENLAKSLAFVPYVGAEDLYRPILGKGWTLNYEMFFYAIFAACLAFPKKTGLLLAAAALLVLGLTGGSDGGVLWSFYANRIVLFFLVGVAIGYLVTETRVRWPHPRSAALSGTAAATVFAALLLFGDASGSRIVGTGITLLAIGGCLYLVCFGDSRFRSPAVTAIVARLGDASYCLYLFHGFVLTALRPVLQHLSAPLQLALLPLVSAVVTVACVLVHLYVEKPLNARLMKAYKHLVTARATARPPLPSTPET